MNVRSLFVNIGKLLFCGVIFAIGTVTGRRLVTIMGLYTQHIAAMIGSICTHTYLCYVYAKSKSIFVPSIAHIALNNASRSLAYFVVVQNQFMQTSHSIW